MFRRMSLQASFHFRFPIPDFRFRKLAFGNRQSAIAFLVTLLLAAAPARAQQDADTPPPDDGPPPELKPVEMKPTEFGVRFTPGMANAIATQLSRQMTRRYDLSPEQATHSQEVIAQGMMRLAQETQNSGRDAIEFMMETMIANDGMFPAESAQKFAKMMQPVLPAIEKFMNDSGKLISSKMTMKQRLKFTADSAGAMAGLGLFKSRMEKWEKGEVKGNVNPFMDREEEARPAASNPNEKNEVSRARRRADRTMQWQVDNAVNDWQQYVDRAIAYYELNESQTAAAKAILKDCQDRASAVRTTAWRQKLKDNRTRLYLTYEIGPEYSSGPWMAQINREYDDLMHPVNDLYTDLQRRVDGLPTTEQRIRARQRAREEFDKLGVPLPGD